jgi:putative CocE/NonD family hydrolase
MPVSRRNFLTASAAAAAFFAASKPLDAEVLGLPAPDVSTFMRTVTMPMPDGVVLSADLYLPHGDGPFPGLLVRSPYGKENYPPTSAGIMTIARMLEAGFAVCIQDVRGTGQSQGAFASLYDESADGAATFDWMRKQPWCSGNISGLGSSYLGFTQWALSTHQDTAMAANVYVNTAADAYRGWYYSNGGALSIENTDRFAWWVAGWGKDADRKAYFVQRASKQSGRYFDNGAAALAEIGPELPWFRDLMAHPLRDAYWQKQSYSDRFENVTSRGLHVGGWYDFFSSSTVEDYTSLRQQGVSEAVRNGQYLVMGPWSHSNMLGTIDPAFGRRASVSAIDLETIVLSFFKGDDAIATVPRATFFMMGANEWHGTSEFPPEGTIRRSYFLGSEGTLGSEVPKAGDRVVPFDRTSPVPTIGGRLLSIGDTWNDAGPKNQSTLEMRSDVASFTTAPVTERTDIVGRITAQIYASTTMADADICLRITDVAPDGTSRLLCEGMTRLSLREGLDHEAPVVPGTVYPVDIDVSVTANALLPGHSLRVNIAGSNYPNYGLNPNLLKPEEGFGTIALHCGPDARSVLSVPIAPPAA